MSSGELHIVLLVPNTLCWLRVTGWWLADWLADWLINWSPCHVECVGWWTEGASVNKIDYHVSGHVL